MESNNSLVAFVSSANLSKEAQGDLAESLVAQVTEGKVDAVKAFVQIKAIAEVCEKFLKNPTIGEAVRSAVVVRGNDATFGGGQKLIFQVPHATTTHQAATPSISI